MKRSFSPSSLFAGVGVAIAAGMIAVAAPANAATVACAGSIADNVTGTADCEMSTSANQDFINQGTVNTEGFFGFADWAFGGKIGIDAGYNGTGTGKSGTYDFSSLFSNPLVQDVMMVFKSGQGTTLVGYLMDSATGSWTSPFEKAVFGFNGGSVKDVSHISVYYREGSSAAVPEPTTMAGLALAGAGMAAYRRRRAAAKSNG